MTNSLAEVDRTDVIFVIGSNTTWNHPVFASMIKRAVRSRGAKLIVCDPRRIDLVEFADVWLRQRSGSDVALLSGIQHIILKEGWEATEYIRERTEDFEAYRESMEWFTPERVEELTGVPRDQLRAAAELFARGGRGAIYYCMGITQHTHGVDNVKACANLSLITGNLGFEGGGVNPLRGQSNVQGACDMGCLPNVFTGYQPVTSPEVQKKFAQAWGSPETAPAVGLTATQMVPAAGGKIRALYITGENPLVSDPNLNHAEECLKQLDLLVVQDIFLTETAAVADVVLPAAAFAEKAGTVTNTERRVQLSYKAFDPPGGAWEDSRIIAAVAERLGAKGFPGTARALWEELRELTPQYRGMTWERLAECGLQWPCPAEDHPGTRFLHQGKFSRGKALLTPLAYRAPAEEPDAEYPIRLSTGRVLQHYHTGSMTRRARVLDNLVPTGHAEINPQDARRLGVSTGGRIRVTTRRGSIVTFANVVERVAPGEAFVPFHFQEAAANRLTNDALDPVAGIPELKVCAARIEQVER
jgi:predicted molibdopterin-dependent oxidoreductase YjgC